jgi:hypothetical protein
MFCAKQVEGLTASRQILTSKKDSIKHPIESDEGMKKITLHSDHCFLF